MNSERNTRVIIIDDDPRSVDRLSEMLRAYNDLTIVGSAGSVADARKLLADNNADIVFVDIDLPDDNGLVLSHELAALDTPPYIVMYTAYYDRYARNGRAFHNGENDYLLKPIDMCELDKIVQRYRFSTDPEKRELAFRRLPTTGNDGLERIIVAMTKVTSEIRILHIYDIGFFCYNSQRKVWEAVTTDNSTVSLRKTTTALDILNYSPQLVQTHQSYIVNLDYVKLIGKNHVNLFPPFNEAEVLVGRIYFKNLQNRLTFL